MRWPSPVSEDISHDPDGRGTREDTTILPVGMPGFQGIWGGGNLIVHFAVYKDHTAADLCPVQFDSVEFEEEAYRDRC